MPIEIATTMTTNEWWAAVKSIINLEEENAALQTCDDALCWLLNLRLAFCNSSLSAPLRLTIMSGRALLWKKLLTYLAANSSVSISSASDSPTPLPRP